MHWLGFAFFFSWLIAADMLALTNLHYHFFMAQTPRPGVTYRVEPAPAAMCLMSTCPVGMENVCTAPGGQGMALLTVGVTPSRRMRTV